MINNLMYIELKTGYSDDGPAWIGYVKTSKSKKTIYFNDHAFQKNIGNYANYIDIEKGDEYWISGLKKEESNRHWAGHGRIILSLPKVYPRPKQVKPKLTTAMKSTILMA